MDIPSLFKLRGELPRSTYLAIEIIGFIILIAVWQIVASIGTTSSTVFNNSALQWYYPANTSANDQTLRNAQIILYNQPLNPPTDTLLTNALKQIQANGSTANLLLVTPQPDLRALQIFSNYVSKDIALHAAALSNPNDLTQLANATNATILTTTQLAQAETPEITASQFGKIDQIELDAAKQQIHFKAKKDWISDAILPSPLEVIQAIPVLFSKYKLVENVLYSLYINFSGYILALLVALPIGFCMGLFPLFRALFSRNVNALRFLPLTALTGLFIAWFGLGNNMKIAFLAFGILVYLVPIIIQRIDEVDDVYVQTAYTLGANKWQQITSIFLPSVLSKISDDVRVLVAISWTYIIAAEVINANAGGIGALAFKCARQALIDKVFAILLIIILIGFCQDKLFLLLDRLLFAHKHQQTH